MTELEKIKKLDPAKIVTPKQGAAEIKIIHKAIAAARLFGRKREEVNDIAEKLIRHVRATGKLIEQITRKPGNRQPLPSDWKRFLTDAKIGSSTAWNWQSLHTEYKDDEFEQRLEELRSDPECYLILSDFYKRIKAPKIDDDDEDDNGGKFKTIVIDPPWPIEKILRKERPNQHPMDYPLMTLDEIASLPIKENADLNGCHVYLWFTQKYCRVAYKLFDAWGVTDECFLTWVKNVGFTPFSWMYSTEHVLFGRYGNLPLLKKGKRLDFAAKVREHSRKPDEFYNLVCEVSPGPRLDWFSREKRDGFKQKGNQRDQFNAVVTPG